MACLSLHVSEKWEVIRMTEKEILRILPRLDVMRQNHRQDQGNQAKEQVQCKKMRLCQLTVYVKKHNEHNSP